MGDIINSVLFKAWEWSIQSFYDALFFLNSQSYNYNGNGKSGILQERGSWQIQRVIRSEIDILHLRTWIWSGTSCILLVTLLYFGNVMWLWKKNNAYINRRVKNGVRKYLDPTMKKVSYKNIRNILIKI